jgi:hypothetical protein
MAKTAPSARIRTHARRYWVTYWPSKAEYKKIDFDSFWASLRFWWGVRRHPNIYNVKWEFEYE